MQSHLIFQFLLLSILLFLNPSHCFSACDEIDITFVIDVDSIIANGDNVKAFITKIIWSGSSEHTGFSAVIYGDNIPNHQRIKLISLHDTKSDTQRQDAENKVESILEGAFKNIKSNKDVSVKSIGLVPAFKIATDQSQPKTLSMRQRRLGYNPKTKHQRVMGKHDGQVQFSHISACMYTHHYFVQRVYIIFDHHNLLLDNSNDVDICELFHHLDTNQVLNDDEAPYFMMGQAFDHQQIKEVMFSKIFFIGSTTLYAWLCVAVFRSNAMIKHHNTLSRINIFFSFLLLFHLIARAWNESIH